MKGVFFLTFKFKKNEKFAETEGFEPSIPFRGIHTFQACSFNHSDKSPFKQAAKINFHPFQPNIF